MAGPKWSFEKIQSVEMDRNSIGDTLVNDATSLVFLKYGVFLAHIVALHCPSYHHSVLVRLDYFLVYNDTHYLQVRITGVWTVLDEWP